MEDENDKKSNTRESNTREVSNKVIVSACSALIVLSIMGFTTTIAGMYRNRNNTSASLIEVTQNVKSITESVTQIQKNQAEMNQRINNNEDNLQEHSRLGLHTSGSVESWGLRDMQFWVYEFDKTGNPPDPQQVKRQNDK